MSRSRVVEWADPTAIAAALGDRDGLEGMRAMIAGEIPPPPIAPLLRMTLEEVGEGRALFALEPGEEHYNTGGAVHGGITATILDSAMGCAVKTTMPAGAGYTTLELKVNMVRPITLATGRILAEGTVLHRGGRIATADGRVTAEADGKLLAHATTTCLILTHQPRTSDARTGSTGRPASASG